MSRFLTYEQLDEMIASGVSITLAENGRVLTVWTSLIHGSIYAWNGLATGVSIYWRCLSLRRPQMSTKAELEAAIQTWRQLAADELRRIDLGIACDPYAARCRADGYMRTVQALEIQLVTGVAVCSCHHKPFSEGMRL